MLADIELSPRQERALRRLCETPDYVSFRGHGAIACYALGKSGLALFVSHDKWAGVIYQATDAGREWVKSHAR